MSSSSLAHNVDLAGNVDRPRRTDHHVVRFRPPELLRLMAIRYGRAISNDEAGRRFRDRVLDTFALCGSEGRHRAENFLTFRCRWMTPAELAIAVEEAFHSQRLWSAEALGNDLDLTEAEREKAKIKTFRAAGMTDAAMKAARNAKAAARKRRERLQQRLEAKPRVPRPAARVHAILNVLPDDGEWWNVGAVVSELQRSKAIAFATLDKDAGSLRPAVHRVIKQGVKEGRIETRKVRGSKMPEAMELRRRLGT